MYHSDFGDQENKICHCFHFLPFCLPWSGGTSCHKLIGLNAMILVFGMLSFKLAFSLSYFTLIRRLFSSSSFSAIRMVSPAYLMLSIFLQQSWFQLLIHSAWDFAWLYSAYKLNKVGDNVQPCYTPFPILNQSIVPGPHLTDTSWFAYRLLKW